MYDSKRIAQGPATPDFRFDAQKRHQSVGAQPAEKRQESHAAAPTAPGSRIDPQRNIQILSQLRQRWQGLTQSSRHDPAFLAERNQAVKESMRDDFSFGRLQELRELSRGKGAVLDAPASTPSPAPQNAPGSGRTEPTSTVPPSTQPEPPPSPLPGTQKQPPVKFRAKKLPSSTLTAAKDTKESKRNSDVKIIRSQTLYQDSQPAVTGRLKDVSTPKQHGLKSSAQSHQTVRPTPPLRTDKAPSEVKFTAHEQIRSTVRVTVTKKPELREAPIERQPVGGEGAKKPEQTSTGIKPGETRVERQPVGGEGAKKPELTSTGIKPGETRVERQPVGGEGAKKPELTSTGIKPGETRVERQPVGGEGAKKPELTSTGIKPGETRVERQPVGGEGAKKPELTSTGIKPGETRVERQPVGGEGAKKPELTSTGIKPGETRVERQPVGGEGAKKPELTSTGIKPGETRVERQPVGGEGAKKPELTSTGIKPGETRFDTSPPTRVLDIRPVKTRDGESARTHQPAAGENVAPRFLEIPAAGKKTETIPASREPELQRSETTAVPRRVLQIRPRGTTSPSSVPGDATVAPPGSGGRGPVAESTSGSPKVASPASGGRGPVAESNSGSPKVAPPASGGRGPVAESNSGSPKVAPPASGGRGPVAESNSGSPKVAPPASGGRGPVAESNSGSPKVAPPASGGRGPVAESNSGSPKVAPPASGGRGPVAESNSGSPKVAPPASGGRGPVAESNSGSPKVASPASGGRGPVAESNSGSPKVAPPASGGRGPVAESTSDSPKVAPPASGGRGPVAESNSDSPKVAPPASGGRGPVAESNSGSPKVAPPASGGRGPVAESTSDSPKVAPPASGGRGPVAESNSGSPKVAPPGSGGRGPVAESTSGSPTSKTPGPITNLDASKPANPGVGQSPSEARPMASANQNGPQGPAPASSGTNPGRPLDDPSPASPSPSVSAQVQAVADDLRKPSSVDPAGPANLAYAGGELAEAPRTKLDTPATTKLPSATGRFKRATVAASSKSEGPAPLDSKSNVRETQAPAPPANPTVTDQASLGAASASSGSGMGRIAPSPANEGSLDSAPLSAPTTEISATPAARNPLPTSGATQNLTQGQVPGSALEATPGPDAASPLKSAARPKSGKKAMRALQQLQEATANPPTKVQSTEAARPQPGWLHEALNSQGYSELNRSTLLANVSIVASASTANKAAVATPTGTGTEKKSAPDRLENYPTWLDQSGKLERSAWVDTPRLGEATTDYLQRLQLQNSAKPVKTENPPNRATVSDSPELKKTIQETTGPASKTPEVQEKVRSKDENTDSKATTQPWLEAGLLPATRGSKAGKVEEISSDFLQASSRARTPEPPAARLRETAPEQSTRKTEEPESRSARKTDENLEGAAHSGVLSQHLSQLQERPTTVAKSSAPPAPKSDSSSLGIEDSSQRGGQRGGGGDGQQGRGDQRDQRDQRGQEQFSKTGKANLGPASSPLLVQASVTQELQRLDVYRRAKTEETLRIGLRQSTQIDGKKSQDLAYRHAPHTIPTLLKKAYRTDLIDNLNEQEVINCFGLILKMGGEFTYAHTARVLELSMDLADEMGIKDPNIRKEIRGGAIFKDIGETSLELENLPTSKKDQIFKVFDSDDIRKAGLLHDIGKVRVPPEILYKPGKLTEEEFAQMKMHPIYGEEMIYPIASLRHLCPVIRGHHERWDGKGYPDGLAGDSIPMAARVIAVADVFDALHAERPYKASMPVEKVRAILQEGAGSHFDPDVVAAFNRVLDRRYPQLHNPFA